MFVQEACGLEDRHTQHREFAADTSSQSSFPPTGPFAGETAVLNRVSYLVTADAEPSALSRLLELFVARDFIPDQVDCRRQGEKLLIRLEVAGLALGQDENLRRRMENILPVEQARMERV